MIRFTLNGQPKEIEADPDKPLLWVLRDDLGLTGTKYGCGQALCGACTVHIDGAPTRSCQTSVGDVAGKNVLTIEGLQGEVAQAVQTSWIKLDVPQCGYCQSGQVMAAIALLSANRKPSDSEIDDAMSGNLCRCANYHRIRAAVHEASRLLGA
ncbi:(2Fe-2S)-binding protein [Rhodoblastus sp.]|uniref:(2Fe-2S)-binding protein n=1 Tax=Rhodoblastus sp. TaxID=1962975 RepID=UPI0026307BD8|nr:(2Fe-2S)-binding protein [Rhodoblastus sp.]